MGNLTVPTSGVVSGLAMAGDINGVAAVLATMVQGTTAPTASSTGLTSIAGLWWHDTSNKVVKLRNQADTAWIIVGTIDETAGVFHPNPAFAADVTIAGGNLAVTQSAQAAAISLNSSGGDGRVYQLLSYTNGYFAIADVIAGANRMVIDPAGSVSFTGAAFAPTAAPGTNNTQLATTAFVQAATPTLFSAVGDVTGFRALGTVYTNSTGKPMFISVTARSTGNGAAVQITIGAVALPPGQRTAGSQNNIDVNSTAIVPAGANYLANVTNGAGTLTGWVEIS